MTTLRRLFVTMSCILLASVFLGACGNAQMPTTTTGSSNTGMNYGNYSMSTPTASTMYATPTAQNMMNPTPTMGDNGDMNAFIHTTTVTINMTRVEVLTTNNGFLLYYYRKDSMDVSTCSGACAQTWPPLLAPQGMLTVTSSVKLPRQLSVHPTVNGNQVCYDGHPLYTYVGDTKPGEFTGRGIGNAWYLVGITL
ncbi:MAG TPA: hypothetical protein VKV19_01535 [Ktedonobacteraceae bacterium]|jgi:predicted lipoprotein with Yx(FWY)xxD motif|nr:hypothetical protein [Ktedonobacteraceae bacterium]